MNEVEKITSAMMALHPEMPAERAQHKASETGRGILFLALGAFFILLGFGLAITVLLVTKAAPSIPLLILAAAPVLPGAYFLLAGGNLISRDAMDAAEHSGGIISRTVAKALRPVRRPSTPTASGES